LMEAGFRSDVEFVMAHDHSNAELTAQMQAASNNPIDDSLHTDASDSDLAKNSSTKGKAANKNKD